MELLSEKYSEYLHPLREQPLRMLPDLKFDKDAVLNVQRTVDRLRVSVALLNDLKPQDYPIVRFLFAEDVKAYRHSPKDASLFHNLRLSGLLLIRYKNPDDLWALYEAHKIEKGFDIEHVLAAGIEPVFAYLQKSHHRNKAALLRKIGSSPAKSKYSPAKIDDWLAEQEDYLESYLFPLKDEISFAVIMQEPERVKELLPQWIQQQKEWNDDTTLQYIGLAKRANDTHAEIHALELYTSNYANRLTLWFRYRLAELYLLHERKDDGTRLLYNILKDTCDKELCEAALSKLCETAVLLNGYANDLLPEIIHLIGEYKKKYKKLPFALKKAMDKVLAKQDQ